MRKWRILSPYDGMACGALALQAAGIEIESYDAFEIDKYAIQTAAHNFPFIKHHGDVFKADFTEFKGVDLVCGGSPCTYWSIAQKNNRETEASGMGWELFSQYVRAIKEAEPKYFIYENNKSMSKAIRESIDKAFGFEAVLINSALVSAQNRQRLYWVGKRNADGTYSKVNVEQPADRGILLKDILEGGEAWQDKAFAYTTRCQAATPHDTLEKHRHTMAAEPVIFQYPHGKNNGGCKYDKAPTMTSRASWESNNKVLEPVRIPEYGASDKSRPVTYSYAQQGPGQIAKNCFPENPNKQRYDYVAEPVNEEDNNLSDEYYHGGFKSSLIGMVETPMTGRNGKQPSQHCRVYSCEDKYPCIDADARKRAIVPLRYSFATPCEWDEKGRPTKAVSAADGKTYTVYEVKDGKITIKGKQYPIKLADGFYIIRKLTVRECMRLQTVPEWYEFPVSDSQAYKMLGNGWTVSIIQHLLESILKMEEE